MITNQTLKNAARAIGYDLWSDPDGSHYLVDYDGVKLKRWDPEHNSGDSFELMTTLRLCVDTYAGMITDAEERNHEFSPDGSESVRAAILYVAGCIGAAL
jgi:hypothetical protein